MSLILDALRKSDVERSKKEAPGIGTPAASGSDQPAVHWRWIVPALLVLNAVFLAWLLLKPAAPAEPVASASSQVSGGAAIPPVATAVSTSPASAATPATDVASAETRRAVPGRKAEVRSLIGESERAVDTGPAVEPVTASVGTPVSATAQPRASVAPPAANPTTARAEEASLQLPTMNELLADGRLRLQPMNLDLHVYSDTPSRRFAFIDGQKVVEGERVATGAEVIRITPAGVVMEYQRQRFLMPRR